MEFDADRIVANARSSRADYNESGVTQGLPTAMSRLFNARKVMNNDTLWTREMTLLDDTLLDARGYAEEDTVKRIDAYEHYLERNESPEDEIIRRTFLGKYWLEDYIKNHTEGSDVKASTHFRKVTEKADKPQDLADAWINQGNVALARFCTNMQRKNLENAFEAYNTAIRQEGTDDKYKARAMAARAYAEHHMFKYSGNMHSLNDAILHFKDALKGPSDDYKFRRRTLCNLSEVLATQYYVSGFVYQLEEAIETMKKAAELYKDSDNTVDKAHYLSTYANLLIMRYEQNGSIEDRDLSLRLHERALSLQPSFSSQHAGMLTSQSYALWVAYTKYKENIGLLEDSVSVCQRAMDLLDPKDPRYCSNLYQKAHRTFLLKRKKNSPERQESPVDMVKLAYKTREISNIPHDAADLLLHADILFSEEDGSVQDVINILRKVIDLHSAHGKQRMQAALRWSNIACLEDDPTAFSAFSTAMSITSEYLASYCELDIHYQVLDQSGIGTLCPMAVEYSLEHDNVEAAVQYFHQGTEVIQSALIGAGVPYDRLALAQSDELKTLAKQFKKISEKLRELTVQPLTPLSSVIFSTPISTKENILQQRAAAYQSLRNEFQYVVKQIRRHSGYETFLDKVSFNELRSAANDGPVILLNTYDMAHAIILTSDISEDCQYFVLDEGVTRDWANVLRENIEVLVEKDSGEEYPPDYFEGKFSGTFGDCLEELWTKICERVVNELDEMDLPQDAEFWWFPGNDLMSLPLHFAGSGEEWVFEKYRSYFTNSFQALMRDPIEVDKGYEGPLRILVIAQSGKLEEVCNDKIVLITLLMMSSLG